MATYENICPCQYCGKKDKVRFESCEKVFEDFGVVTFYRIRCTRLLCRIRSVFEMYYDMSSSKEAVIRYWNERYWSVSNDSGRWREVDE